MAIRNYNDSNFEKRSRNLVYIMIAFIVVIALGVGGFFVFRSMNKTDLPQSVPSAIPSSEPSTSDSAQSAATGPQRDEKLFEKGDESSLSQIESSYNMDALKNVDDTSNPFKSNPFGIYPYQIEVAQVWKDTYDNSEWQTMTASVLSTLETLWSDKNYEKAVLTRDESDQARITALRALTYRDVIYSRLGPVSGVSVGNNAPREATTGDFAYYNALVPVLDGSGYIPGTKVQPGTYSRTVSVLDVKVEEPGTGKADASAQYANYPRFSITRVVDYGTVKYSQNVSFYVQKDNSGSWKLVQIEYGEPTIF